MKAIAAELDKLKREEEIKRRLAEEKAALETAHEEVDMSTATE